jgi:hypothetical protein
VSDRQSIFLRKRLERSFRPRSEMLDHLGGGKRSEPAGGLVVGASCNPEQKTGGKEIARSGRVDQP